MCLIVFAWQPGQREPLIVAANRDEFYARPARPLAPWPDQPAIVAGRDLQANGTWLGITRTGRFAALTNIREPGQPLGERSRGELPAAFLGGEMSPAQYLEALAAHAEEYSGFNLLVGTRDELWYLNSRLKQPQPLSAGVYGVSNAALDTPWPKLQKAKAAFIAQLREPRAEMFMRLLADAQPAPDEELPETGVGLATERMLSSAFIASAGYGTRASTVLIVSEEGETRMLERSFGPNGVVIGEVSKIL